MDTVLTKEPIKRFVFNDKMVEYTNSDLETLYEGISEKDFDSRRYTGNHKNSVYCKTCAGCGKGACKLI